MIQYWVFLIGTSVDDTQTIKKESIAPLNKKEFEVE